jgi:hypothetical protein
LPVGVQDKPLLSHRQCFDLAAPWYVRPHRSVALRVKRQSITIREGAIFVNAHLHQVF